MLPPYGVVFIYVHMLGKTIYEGWKMIIERIENYFFNRKLKRIVSRGAINFHSPESGKASSSVIDFGRDMQFSEFITKAIDHRPDKSMSISSIDKA